MLAYFQKIPLFPFGHRGSIRIKDVKDAEAKIIAVQKQLTRWLETNNAEILTSNDALIEFETNCGSTANPLAGIGTGTFVFSHKDKAVDVTFRLNFFWQYFLKFFLWVTIIAISAFLFTRSFGHVANNFLSIMYALFPLFLFAWLGNAFGQAISFKRELKKVLRV